MSGVPSAGSRVSLTQEVQEQLSRSAPASAPLPAPSSDGGAAGARASNEASSSSSAAAAAAKAAAKAAGPSVVELDILELENSCKHLERSNVELEAMISGAEPDPDFVEAIRDNEEALLAKRHRIAKLRQLVNDAKSGAMPATTDYVQIDPKRESQAVALLRPTPAPALATAQAPAAAPAPALAPAAPAPASAQAGITL